MKRILKNAASKLGFKKPFKYSNYLILIATTAEKGRRLNKMSF